MKTDPFANLTQMVDSVSEKADSLPAAGLVEEEKTEMPTEADELFDDFIFNYASNEALQRRRTTFPLPYYKGDSCLKVSKGAWKHDFLFAKQSHYTLMFDREEDMDLVGDTTLTSVQVEWFFLTARTVRRYYFERKQGKWMLEAINLRKMQETDNEDFVSFYTRFATDSVYQAAHIHNPLEFITIDPDDEFSILETTLEASQWRAFSSALPTDRLSNINYGQKNADGSPTKILKINGIGNGYSMVYHFRKQGGEWKLYRFEDTSI